MQKLWCRGWTRLHNRKKRIIRAGKRDKDTPTPTVRSPTKPPSLKAVTFKRRTWCRWLKGPDLQLQCLKTHSTSDESLTLFCWWLLSPLIPTISASSTGLPNPRREGANGDLQFRLCSCVSLSSPCSVLPWIKSGCGSLNLPTSAARRSIFDDKWTRHWPMYTAEYCQESLYWLVFGSTLGLWSLSPVL